MDDLLAKAFLGSDRDGALDGLRCTLSAAAALRNSGLESTLAPVLSTSNVAVEEFGGHYAVAIYPWIDATTFLFFEPLPEAEALTLATLLARLYASPRTDQLAPEGLHRAIEAKLQPAGRPWLEAALQALAEPWSGKPYSDACVSCWFAALPSWTATCAGLTCWWPTCRPPRGRWWGPTASRTRPTCC